MIRILLSIFAFFVVGGHAIGMKQIASIANGLLKQSQIPGQSIRLCSCTEQRQCVAEMEKQGQRCADQCVSIFKGVTGTPTLLIPCYRNLIPQFHTLADCMENNVQSCSATPTNQQVPYTSIDKLLNILEEEGRNKKLEIMQQPMIQKIRPVAEAAFSFAGCVKRCFVQQNSGGYCFDRIQCQPNIATNNLIVGFKRCSKGFNWKKEAGQLCTCAQNAGVSSLGQVCPLLNAMG